MRISIWWIFFVFILALSLYFPNNQMFIICKSREKCLWLDSATKEFLKIFLRITQLNLICNIWKVCWMFNNWVLLCRRNFKINCKRKEFLNYFPQWFKGINCDQKLHLDLDSHMFLFFPERAFSSVLPIL